MCCEARLACGTLASRARAEHADHARPLHSSVLPWLAGEPNSVTDPRFTFRGQWAQPLRLIAQDPQRYGAAVLHMDEQVRAPGPSVPSSSPQRTRTSRSRLVDTGPKA
jgi:hypothetical protein